MCLGFNRFITFLTRPFKAGRTRIFRTAVVVCLLALGWMPAPVAISAEEEAPTSLPLSIKAFQPGETLTYDISWSNIFTAGIATMQVEMEKSPEGRDIFKFIVHGHSTGLVDKIYPVNDTVQSVFDPLIMQSLSYSLSENFKKKKRLRVMVFDHSQKTVVSRLNEDPPETLVVPDPVQDALSTLYYLRTREDFMPDKHIDIDVVDSGKNWSVEVYTLGREKVTTPAGEFETIKVMTHPKYQGTFLNKGEVFFWLTDDIRKIPVLMKSTIAVGSFVFTLTEIKPGDNQH